MFFFWLLPSAGVATKNELALKTGQLLLNVIPDTTWAQPQEYKIVVLTNELLPSPFEGL